MSRISTYTCDKSANDKLCCTSRTGANASDLDDDTNDHDSSTNENSLAATELVTKRENEDSTEKTADSVDGNNETLPVTAPASFGEVLKESVGFDDTRHDTLVITEEKEIGSGDGGNKHLELSARGAPVCGNTL